MEFARTSGADDEARTTVIAESALRILRNHALDGDQLQRASTAALIRRFEVRIQRADGTRQSWQALGGTSIDHSITAMEAAGLNGKVSVRAVRAAA